jgi:hypothetical protein
LLDSPRGKPSAIISSPGPHLMRRKGALVRQPGQRNGRLGELRRGLDGHGRDVLAGVARPERPPSFTDTEVDGRLGGRVPAASKARPAREWSAARAHSANRHRRAQPPADPRLAAHAIERCPASPDPCAACRPAWRGDQKGRADRLGVVAQILLDLTVALISSTGKSGVMGMSSRHGRRRAPAQPGPAFTMIVV